MTGGERQVRLRAARHCRLVVGIGLAHGGHGVVRETRGATSLCLVRTADSRLTDGVAVPSFSASL